MNQQGVQSSSSDGYQWNRTRCDINIYPTQRIRDANKANGIMNSLPTPSSVMSMVKPIYIIYIGGFIATLFQRPCYPIGEFLLEDNENIKRLRPSLYTFANQANPNIKTLSNKHSAIPNRFPTSPVPNPVRPMQHFPHTISTLLWRGGAHAKEQAEHSPTSYRPLGQVIAQPVRGDLCKIL